MAICDVVPIAVKQGLSPGQQWAPQAEDVFAMLGEACAAGGVSAAMFERLRAAGAFAGHGGGNPIAQYSSRFGCYTLCAPALPAMPA